MLDFHSHILPGIDDGSKDVAMSVEMIRESVRQGITGIVFTPHFYADSDEPGHFLKKRQEALDQLLSSLESEEDLPHFLTGAEVHYYRGMGQSDTLKRFCIGNSNLVLIEMPFRRWGQQEMKDLKEIRRNLGLQVIIAHIDRYLSIQDSDHIDALCEDCGALIQANADFFLKYNTRRKALKMLKKGKIHLLGSDCHNMSNRAPNLGDAVTYIQLKLGTDILNAIDMRGNALFEQAEDSSDSI